METSLHVCAFDVVRARKRWLMRDDCGGESSMGFLGSANRAHLAPAREEVRQLSVGAADMRIFGVGETTAPTGGGSPTPIRRETRLLSSVRQRRLRRRNLCPCPVTCFPVEGTNLASVIRPRSTSPALAFVARPNFFVERRAQRRRAHRLETEARSCCVFLVIKSLRLNPQEAL